MMQGKMMSGQVAVVPARFMISRNRSAIPHRRFITAQHRRCPKLDSCTTKSLSLKPFLASQLPQTISLQTYSSGLCHQRIEGPSGLKLRGHVAELGIKIIPVSGHLEPKSLTSLGANSTITIPDYSCAAIFLLVVERGGFFSFRSLENNRYCAVGAHRPLTPTTLFSLFRCNLNPKNLY